MDDVLGNCFRAFVAARADGGVLDTDRVEEGSKGNVASDELGDKAGAFARERRVRVGMMRVGYLVQGDLCAHSGKSMTKPCDRHAACSHGSVGGLLLCYVVMTSGEVLGGGVETRSCLTQLRCLRYIGGSGTSLLFCSP